MELGVFQCAADAPFAARLQQLEASLAASAVHLDLVLCPELFPTGYGPKAHVAAFDEAAAAAADDALGDIARRHGTALAYGTVDHGAAGRRNVARLVGRDGRVLARHAKRALPPFPVESLFAPGAETTVVGFEGVKIGLLVCFDVEFPENVRALAQAGAELVLVPSALWDRVPIVARMVVPVRAYENGVFLAYANYCGALGGQGYLGESVICGPDGGVLARADHEPGLHHGWVDTAEIARARRALPFLELARTPAAAS